MGCGPSKTRISPDPHSAPHQKPPAHQKKPDVKIVKFRSAGSMELHEAEKKTWPHENEKKTSEENKDRSSARVVEIDAEAALAWSKKMEIQRQQTNHSFKSDAAADVKEDYSIEEFTALSAFGVSLKIEHSEQQHVEPEKPHLVVEKDKISAVELAEKIHETSNLRYSVEELNNAFGVSQDSINVSMHSLRDIPTVIAPAAQLNSRIQHLKQSASNSNLSATSKTNLTSTTNLSRSNTGLNALKQNKDKLLSKPLQNKSPQPYDPIALEMPLFEREIKKRMQPVVYQAGTFIIRKHEIGQEMYFLSSGTVEVVSGDGATVYSLINHGSFFGELGVLFNVPRTASIRSVNECSCMVLTRDNLEVVLKYFPHIAKRFRQVAEDRMNEVKRKISFRRQLEFEKIMDDVVEAADEVD